MIVVDWSAAARPRQGADSIWCALARDGSDHVELANPSTRSAADALVREWIERERTAGREILVGIDAGLGYPAGTAAALGLDGSPWRATWDLIAAIVNDHDDNANDRFVAAARLNERFGAAVLWGRPWQSEIAGLPATRPAYPVTTARGVVLAEHRETEIALRAAGLRPQPVWKLAGAGSVGSQSLLAIPRVRGWRDDLGGAVWPFEPTADAAIVYAEVYPSAFAHPPGGVRDAEQVRATSLALRQRALPAITSPAATAEEGWVLT